MILTTAATIAGHRIVRTFGTTMMEDARAEALQRLVADAEAQGPNAVTDLRFNTAAAEVLACGAAVTVEPG